MNFVTKIVPNSITRKVGEKVLLTKKHSPAVLFGVGVVGVVATAVMASRATLKLEETLEETNKNLTMSKALRHSEHPKYSEEDYRKDQAYIFIRAGLDITKLYAPTFLVGAISIGCLAGSHNILTKRNAALTAAYATVDKAFSQYRQRVVEELGEDKDRQFRYGGVKETRTVVDEKTGVSKPKDVIFVDGRDVSGYARFFDQTNRNWNPRADYNMFFLKCQQNYMNDLLKARGHVFLNEVYDCLGFERTKEGAVVGWVLGGDGDNAVDFGMFDGSTQALRDFVNGNEASVLLDFNVDGIIYDKI